MRWSDELREQLTAPECVREPPTFEDDSERDAARRDVLRMQMCVAGEVLRVAHRVLMAARRAPMFERGFDMHGLKIGERSLEVRYSADGLAIEVCRETGVVDTLHVEDSSVFDARGNLVAYAEGYFGSHVLELAGP
ncbi:MAG: hypothetical protein ACO1OB_26380 [Archangium sp.]